MMRFAARHVFRIVAWNIPTIIRAFAVAVDGPDSNESIACASVQAGVKSFRALAVVPDNTAPEGKVEARRNRQMTE